MRGILQQLCPRCRAGKIFHKSVWVFPQMYERCPACDLKFEREAGYFLGGRDCTLLASGARADLDGPRALDLSRPGD